MKQQTSERPRGTRVVRFLDEGNPTPVPFDATQQLADAVARATYISAGSKDKFALKFSSLFIGMLATPGPVSEWLRKQFETSEAKLEGLLQPYGLSPDVALEIPVERSKGDEEPILRSASARSALTEAERLARDMGGVADTRHVMAAYISLPSYHDDDFRELNIDRIAWAASFSSEMASRYPNEASLWQGFAGRVFPQTPSSDDAILNLDAGNLEQHVAQALAIAAALPPDGDPIGPIHIIRATLSVAQSSGSAAFKRLEEIAPLPHPPVSPAGRQKSVRLAKELARQFAIAQRPRAGESGPRRVWGRDLVTAALLCNDAELFQTLRAVNQPIDIVRDRWFAFVTADDRDRTRDEWVTWWALAGVPIPGPRRSGYATETDQGEDKLGVEAEARAFARLIMDRQIQPPLSIGLLGDWGSGKSFFIEQIKKQIKSLKDEGRPELFGNVVEIEFNAWHASDSNLWASLVTYIFDEIWKNIGGDTSPEEAQKFLVEAIGEARGAIFEAEGQVELARAGLATAEKELQKQKEKLALDKFVKREATDKLKQIAKDVGWHEAIETINDVDGALKSLTASSNRLRLVMTTLIEKPIYIGLPAALLAVVTIAIWFAVERYNLGWMRGLPQWAAAAIAGITAAITPIKAASLKVGQLADRLTTIRDQYDAGVKEAGGSKEDIRKVGDARRELESAEASVAAAKARLAELLNQQAALDPRKRLGAFLEDRVQSTVYRSQQGIISLVHKDFQQLSNYMKELRENPSKAAAAGHNIKPLERIVLYVDDLDRCRPDHVVHMLEAVHLLLALDLFVVVVAVDSRWLSRALELHYKELLGDDGESDDAGLRASTPQNYLEKIFQVTYALGPMDPRYFKNYVASLAGVESKVGEDSKKESTDTRNSQIPTETGHSNAGDKDKTDTKKPEAKTELQSNADDAGSKKEEETQIALPPSSAVRIDEDEQKILCALAPLLPTPRVAKRLVNVYRLIKASKTIDELEKFHRANRAKSNLLMLAILFGRPAVASLLLRELHHKEPPFDNSKKTLRDAIRNRSTRFNEAKHVQEEWRSLLYTLDTLKIEATVEECAREPIEIARYSLVSGHDWHTWTRRQEPEGSSE